MKLAIVAGSLGWGLTGLLLGRLLWPVELECVIGGVITGTAMAVALRLVGMVEGWFATAAITVTWTAASAATAVTAGRESWFVISVLSVMLANGATGIAVSLDGLRVSWRTRALLAVTPLLGILTSAVVLLPLLLITVATTSSLPGVALDLIITAAAASGGAVTTRTTIQRLQRDAQASLEICHRNRHHRSEQTSPAIVTADAHDIPDGDAYRYEAFISYRTATVDRHWAVWLQRALEQFRTPRTLVRSGRARLRFRPVFVDSTELAASSDLTVAIEAALRASRCLIVICSPRTAESRWIAKECQYFRSLGRGARILYLLTEGDLDSRLWRTIDGSEPLAVDVRPSPGERGRRRDAVLRFAAALLGCGFDELRRREQAQRRTRATVIAVASAALSVVLGGALAQSVRSRQRAEETNRIRELEAIARRGDEEASNRPVLGMLLATTALERNQRSGGTISPAIVASARRGLARVGGVAVVKVPDGWPPRTLTFQGSSSTILMAGTEGLHRATLGAGPPTLESKSIPLDGKRYVVRSSPDGRWIVVGGEKGAAYCVGADLSCRVLDDSQGYMTAAFSPDGRLGAIGGSDGRLLVFATGVSEITRRDTFEAGLPIMTVVFSPDSAALAWTASPGDLPYERQDVNPIFVASLDSSGGLAPPTELARMKIALAIGFSHDSAHLFVGDSAGALTAWSLSRLPDKTPLAAVQTEGGFRSLAVSARHDWLVTANDDGRVQLWPFPGHFGEPVSLAEDGGRQHFEVTTRATATSEWVASSGATPHLWDVHTSEKAEPFVTNAWNLPGHDSGATGVAISADGRWLVTASFDGSVRARDLHQRQRTSARLSAMSRPLDMSPDGTTVVFGGAAASGRRIDPATGATIRETKSSIEATGDVLVGNTGKRVALTSSDGKLVVADVHDGELRGEARLRTFASRVDLVAFDSGDRWLFAAADEDARLWRLPAADGDAGIELHRPPGVAPWIENHYHSSKALAADFSHDSRWLAAAFQDGSLVLWSLGDGRRAPEAQLLREHRDAASSVAFTPGDGWLVSAGADRAVVLRRFSRSGLAKEAPIIRREHTGWVVSLAISPDGRWMATGGGMVRSADGRDSFNSDNRVLLWSLTNPLEKPVEIRGHTGWIRELTFNAAGTLLAGSGEDGIRFWDISGSIPVVLPIAFDGEACAPCRFTSDGRWLVSRGSAGSGGAIWSLDPRIVLQQARTVVGRNLEDSEWNEMFPGTERAKTFEDLP